MARPSKYSETRAAKIIEGLRLGLTRTAAAGLVDTTLDSLNRWVKRYASFAAQVDVAEQEAEARYAQVIAKAAFGHEVKRTRKTTRPQVVKFFDDKGRPQERVEYVTEETTETYKEYDWQAAKYWLSRRRRKDWGDSLHVDVDEEIRKLLAFIAGKEDSGAGNNDS